MSLESDLYAHSVAMAGRPAAFARAELDAYQLCSRVKSFLLGGCDRAQLAGSIAAAEIACGQLRAMVGDGLVDLAKAEKLHALRAGLNPNGLEPN